MDGLNYAAIVAVVKHIHTSKWYSQDEWSDFQKITAHTKPLIRMFGLVVVVG